MLHDNLFVVPILSREGKYIHNKDRGVCGGGGTLLRLALSTEG